MIAVIVPAHNEAADIGRCLESITVAARHPGLRGEPVVAVVALDACTDKTPDVCLHHGAVAISIEARCVGVARAAAASHALGLGARWIASTDADTHVPFDWLWKQASCGADAFCGVVEVRDWLDYPAAVRQAFARREHAREGHRHIHGANMGVSAAAYREVGGFSPLFTGRMWRWLRRFSARGPASLGELDQSSPRVPAGQPGHLTGSVASCVPWNAKCSKRVGRCYHRGNWCDDAEARGSPDPRWMAPLPGLRMRGQCPVLSKLPAVRGCMVSRDHLGRGAFVHKVEKRDEGKVGASTNSPKLHVGAGMLMCALNRHSCTRA